MTAFHGHEVGLADETREGPCALAESRRIAGTCGITARPSEARHEMPRVLAASESARVLIRRVTVTHRELHAKGSRALDTKVLSRSGTVNEDLVHVWKINSGQRLVTYAIRTERRHGIGVVGPVVRRRHVGDRIIIASCAKSGEMKVHRETSEVIVDQLATSLERGHWRIALRRFLMLRASDFDIPDQYKARCEALMAACPTRDIRRIQDQVQSWVDMLVPSLWFEKLAGPVDEVGLATSGRQRAASQASS